MGYVEQTKKHTHRGVHYETFLEESDSGLSYWKAWALGIGPLASVGGYSPRGEFSRAGVMSEAKAKIDATPGMAAQQAAYINDRGNWSGGKQPKLNPMAPRFPSSLTQAVGAERAFKHAQAQFHDAMSHTFSEPHIFAEAIRNAEIALRIAKREASVAGMSKYAKTMRNMTETIKSLKVTLKQEQERLRNPALGDYFSAGRRAVAKAGASVAESARVAAERARTAAAAEATRRRPDEPTVEQAIKVLAKAHGVKVNPAYVSNPRGGMTLGERLRQFRQFVYAANREGAINGQSAKAHRLLRSALAALHAAKAVGRFDHDFTEDDNLYQIASVNYGYRGTASGKADTARHGPAYREFAKVGSSRVARQRNPISPFGGPLTITHEAGDLVIRHKANPRVALDWALCKKGRGWALEVVKQYPSQADAEAAMRKKTGGYGSDSLMHQGYSVVFVGAGSRWRVYEKELLAR